MLYFRAFTFIYKILIHMKKLKKTRAKLRPGEEVVGMAVPDFLLNEEHQKKLRKPKSNSKTKSNRKRS
ncbi:hypothetical protein AsAng_0016640 [Aureispira anguillae]|uniref:Uncharacterized protein n=1 Tax=Aureispira anguillae TaxID=2864201 RepID=A0A915YDA4_9BACT|nr:hypothetical protein AsAng_0016640 [Aureispira anguillae]